LLFQPSKDYAFAGSAGGAAWMTDGFQKIEKGKILILCPFI
jgi:hypothetical protein